MLTPYNVGQLIRITLEVTLVFIVLRLIAIILLHDDWLIIALGLHVNC